MAATEAQEQNGTQHMVLAAVAVAVAEEAPAPPVAMAGLVVCMAVAVVQKDTTA